MVGTSEAAMADDGEDLQILFGLGPSHHAARIQKQG